VNTNKKSTSRRVRKKTSASGPKKSTKQLRHESRVNAFASGLGVKLPTRYLDLAYEGAFNDWASGGIRATRVGEYLKRAAEGGEELVGPAVELLNSKSPPLVIGSRAIYISNETYFDTDLLYLSRAPHVEMGPGLLIAAPGLLIAAGGAGDFTRWIDLRRSPAATLLISYNKLENVPFDMREWNSPLAEKMRTAYLESTAAEVMPPVQASPGMPTPNTFKRGNFFGLEQFLSRIRRTNISPSSMVRERQGIACKEDEEKAELELDRFEEEQKKKEKLNKLVHNLQL